MGMTCGHNNGFALVQLIRLAVYCNSARSVKAGDKCVAAGGMCAYFFVLIKKRVMERASFCARVLLTTCPS